MKSDEFRETGIGTQLLEEKHVMEGFVCRVLAAGCLKLKMKLELGCGIALIEINLRHPWVCT